MGRGPGRGRPSRAAGRAFASVEAALLLVMLALLCCLLVVGAGHSRRSAGLAGSLANLRKIGETTGMYSADFDNQAWAFSWQPGDSSSGYEDLRHAPTNAQAVMWQSVDIVRRLSGRDSVPRYDDRFGALSLDTLVLADYLHDSLPAEWMVSPGDGVRQGWAADPDNPPPFDDSAEYNATFCPFGSSYVHMPAFIAPDQKINTSSTIYQDPQTHYLTFIPAQTTFGGQTMTDVAFPANKVLMAERESYFFGPRPVYYLHPSARVPVLMVDGSASPRSTRDANASWKPNQYYNGSLTSTLNYRPRAPYEAPAIDEVNGVDAGLESAYKWTRGGRSGVDFSGEREE